MKIVFFITSSEQSRGGHYYSLLETASVLAVGCDILIVSIGLIESPILKKFEGRYIHVKEDGIVNTFRAVGKVLNNEGADIYHAFDSRAFFYVRVLSLINRVPNVLTKCGGGNAKHYPVCDELVLYSLENLEFYRNKKSFSKTNVTFLPNRVSLPRQDRQRIKEIESELVEGVPVILRISRLATSYEKSIYQAIKLVALLKQEKIKAQLVVVGVVQDADVYKRLKAHAGEYIRFIVDDEYNINASQLIDIADAVVGTGRGFMEAACLGKMMLAPTENLDIPVLVSKENFFDIFKYNFSQRFVSSKNTQDALKDILGILGSMEAKQNKKFIAEMAGEYFMTDRLLQKHLDIYMNIKKPSLRLLDVLKQCVIKITQ